LKLQADGEGDKLSKISPRLGEKNLKQNRTWKVELLKTVLRNWFQDYLRIQEEHVPEIL